MMAFLYSNFIKSRLSHPCPVELCGEGPQRAEDIDRPFHFRFRGFHQLHDEFERILIAASEFPPNPSLRSASTLQQQLLCRTSNTFDVITDNSGATTREDDDRSG